MEWFKFYAAEYLSDPKIRNFSAGQHSCWMHLLAFAANSPTPGVIEYLTEEDLMIYSGIKIPSDEHEKTIGVLAFFQSRKMIEIDGEKIIIKNWDSRQEHRMTGAERQRKYKENNSEKVLESDINYKSDVKGIDISKSRGDDAIVTRGDETVTKSDTQRERGDREIDRRERERIPSSISFLEKIPVEDLKELSDKYKISPRGIQAKAIDLKLYSESKGKTYKNYRSLLESALRRDEIKLRREYPMSRPTDANGHYKNENRPEHGDKNGDNQGMRSVGDIAKGKPKK